MYKQAQAQQEQAQGPQQEPPTQPPPPGDGDTTGKDEDVVDAEFEDASK
jgi:hypothetical protein